ncbi:hypothetical protein BRC91_07635 [Halobacteriales archaeon QS_4_62_28]|nr:MAG: hypothetical protein BRC91_07635 [Halobacteriales archaeon QS_4_62_28]
MNLDELQSVQSRERQTDSLQQLRESFYADAGKFIQQLREERDTAADRADDPFDAPEVNRLTDDINTAEQTVEAIYERRVGKIVKMASLAAADMPAEEEGLTREERDLFETLVGAIENNRDHVLDVLAGEASPGAVAGGSASPDDTAPPEGQAQSGAASGPPELASADGTAPLASRDERDEQGSTTDGRAAVDAADVMGTADDELPPESGPVSGDPPSAGDDQSPASDGGTAPAPETTAPTDLPSGDSGSGDASDTVDRTTVRITDDVGEIFGIDQREYDLSRDDVVTLPEQNAAPLVERDAAEPLD